MMTGTPRNSSGQFESWNTRVDASMIQGIQQGYAAGTKDSGVEKLVIACATAITCIAAPYIWKSIKKAWYTW